MTRRDETFAYCTFAYSVRPSSPFLPTYIPSQMYPWGAGFVASMGTNT